MTAADDHDEDEKFGNVFKLRMCKKKFKFDETNEFRKCLGKEIAFPLLYISFLDSEWSEITYFVENSEYKL